MIIITGAAGFIGSNLTAYLNDSLNISDIIVVDSFKRRHSEEHSAKWKNLVKRSFLDFYEKDEFIQNLNLFKGAK
ncbi:MAG: NAD-dependent epimerase/dehydratase family protein, partial [Candidatus Dadabacteria bacterium]